MEIADLHRQYATYFALSLVTVVFTIILLPSANAYFRRFFGETNAILTIVVTSVIGAAALWMLQNNEWMILKGRMTLHGIKLSAVFATGLGIAIVIADLIIRYPEDTNVPVPQALLFYPAVGFIAEIIFHILPLVLLSLALKPLVGKFGEERVIWTSILLVAALEPTFQVPFGGKSLTWSAVYTWLHIFVIAFLQLHVFQRFDFVSMYVFRLFYYTYWHILWGVIRLKVLF